MKAPGDRIGRFRVERLLGEGGAAEVYQVRHELLDTSYALKLLPVARRGMAKRLIQEGRIQAQLRHPNVVSVTDVVDEKGQIGLVMELIEGPSLEQVIREDGAMDYVEAMDLFAQVLSGVAAAHQAGVLHRDLKPANVLLTTDGEAVVAKVADFGIARMSIDGDPESTTPRNRKPVGTPGYMSPEQMNDPESADARSDVFALGAILYEMLSGRRAFGASTSAKEVLDAVARGRFTPLRQIVPTLPVEIESAVHLALALRPEERFGSCIELADALGIRAYIVPLKTVPVIDDFTPREVPRPEPPPAQPPAFDTVNDFLEDREDEPLPKKGDAVITWSPDEGDDEFGLPNAEGLPVAAARPVRKRVTTDWVPPPTPERADDPHPLDQAPLAAPEADTPRAPERQPLFTPAPRRPARPEPRPETTPRPTPRPEARVESPPRGVENPVRTPEPRPGDTRPGDTRPAKDERARAAKAQDAEPAPPSPVLRALPFIVAPVLLVVALMGGGAAIGAGSLAEAQSASLKQEAKLRVTLEAQSQLVADALRLGTADGTVPPKVAPELFERRLKKSQEAPTLLAQLDASRELYEFMVLQVPTLYEGQDPALLALRRDLEARVRALGEEHQRFDTALDAWRTEASTPTGNLAILFGMAEAPP